MSSSCLVLKSLLLSEPVGSVSPKIITGENIQVIRVENGMMTDIICPAQAFPTPVFRLVSDLQISQKSLSLFMNSS